MSRRLIALVLTVAGFVASPAQSQVQTQAQAPGAALPARLTLPVLLKLVAERSPRLAAEQFSISVAEADRVTAGALPNPSLSYGRFKPSGGGNTLFDGTRQQQIGVELPILISGQRGARIEAAEQGILAARARVGLLGSELALRAAELFSDMQAGQERIAKIEESLAEIQRLATVVSGRLESGVASRYDLTRVEIELAGVAARLAEARTDQADRAAGLATLLGAPGWRPGVVGMVTQSGLSTSKNEWRDKLLAGNPQVIAARREEDVARASLQRTERDTLPVPVLSLGRQMTSEPYGSANFIGLSTEIPLSDSRKGLMARSAAELNAAQRRREAIEAEAGVELQRLLDTLSQRRLSLERFNQNVGARIPALRQMADDAYRLGRGSMLELIDASRSRLELHLTEIDLRTATVQQELRLLALTGKLGEQ